MRKSQGLEADKQTVGCLRNRKQARMASPSDMGGGNLTWVGGIVKGVPEPKGSQIINIGPGNSEKEFGFDSQNKRKPGKSLYELLLCGRSLAGKKKNIAQWK